MSYREVQMWEALTILQRLGRKESIAAVAAATGHTRKTVRRYRRLAMNLGWVPGVHEVDEGLALEVYRQARPGRSDAEPGETERVLLPHKERIEKLVTGPKALKLAKVHILLSRDGICVPYPSLHRFAVTHCSFGKGRVTVRMADSPPGELSEADFGMLGMVFDPETDRLRRAYALIVTLAYSRHQFVHVTFTQKVAAFIVGLDEAWAFFDGVTARLVIDNLKSAVVKADRYDPVFNRTFEEYAAFRGFVIDAAPARMPTAKPHVERAVQYVRENFFRGEKWRNIAHVREEARRWCLSTAGLRTHGTTRKKPLEVFEAEEKAALRLFSGGRFDTPAWAVCKVHPDHTVNFLKAFYTVPTRYIGETVTVCGDSGLVRIYLGGELLKTRPRLPPGGKDIDYDDFPKEKSAYAMRDPNRIIATAKVRGEQLGAFMARLLSGTFPWAMLRQGQKLLRLADKYGASTVDDACATALKYDIINVHRVERIIVQGLEKKIAARLPDAPRPPPTQLPLRFLRDPKSFAHTAKQPLFGAKKEVPNGTQPITENRPQTPSTLGSAPHPARTGRLCQEGEPG